jgi:hypothetical protein
LYQDSPGQKSGQNQPDHYSRRRQSRSHETYPAPYYCLANKT